MLSRLGLSGRGLLVVATSFAGAAAVAWVGLDRDETAIQARPSPDITAQAAAPPAAATLSILSTTNTIEAGTRIAPDEITQITMVQSPGTRDLVSDTPENRQALSDRIAHRTIPAGTPFVITDLQPTPVSRPAVKSVSGTAALLTPGMRAISLPVTTEMAVAGLITRGDRLDILVTYDVPDNIRAVRTVLQNVRVIATDQTTEVSHETPESAPKTVTLELPPEGAKVLALAMRTGNLVLVLSPADGGDHPVIADDEPILSSQISDNSLSGTAPASKSVRIIRGAVKSDTVMIPTGSTGERGPGSNASNVMTVTPTN
ncbi:Flp pilus assembly protein CpaB [Roseovarius sp. MMSF_3281]|uniref:Flp pilus assembly protein CpaB n=1 Tax=Roseovarius sp. MMSF_3281 TaxID=3046694 RepID=UPI00273D4A98|nr:Flp pilus assembly protein CpaB [Roseovarius sp. MMSF_3281]